MRPEAQPWWRQAQADLDTARLTRDANSHYAAVWFAQQAVEKALKAVYIEQQGVLAPRTHDLEYLGDEVGVPTAVEADIVIVNPAFGAARYPDSATGHAPVDDVTPVMAQSCVTAAESVLQWTDQQLNPASTSP